MLCILFFSTLSASPLELARRAVIAGDSDGDGMLSAKEFNMEVSHNRAFLETVYQALEKGKLVDKVVAASESKEGELDAKPVSSLEKGTGDTNYVLKYSGKMGPEDFPILTSEGVWEKIMEKVQAETKDDEAGPANYLWPSKVFYSNTVPKDATSALPADEEFRNAVPAMAGSKREIENVAVYRVGDKTYSPTSDLIAGWYNFEIGTATLEEFDIKRMKFTLDTKKVAIEKETNEEKKNTMRFKAEEEMGDDLVEASRKAASTLSGGYTTVNVGVFIAK